MTPNGTATIENVWHISDPSGIGGQLIPPDQRFTTTDTLNPTFTRLGSSTIIWHTSPKSHAKVQEIAFSGVPCWQVWLPSGVMEEFGCTHDSQQTYNTAGVWHMDK